MASKNSKLQVKRVQQRSFLNKDADSLRADLLQSARTFFADRIQDFSEASPGGLFLDFAATVGDVMSFYLDHQFNELDAGLAVESQNIERHLRIAGVPITGASPAVASVSWAIEVPAVRVGSVFKPQESALPTILEGSIVESDDGISFELTEDLNFANVDRAGELRARVVVGQRNADGTPATYLLTMGGPGNRPATPDGICVSGFRSAESFSIPNVFQPFREITLANEDVAELLSVSDSDGNIYYEVDSLAQDTVFRGLLNVNEDNELVEENLEVIPAPYRFTRRMNFDTKLTTLRFGSGNAVTLNDDLIPDPSELALPLYGKKTFTRFTLDPGQLLATQTLGVSPVNTTITVTYRHGGGLSHNVAARTLSTVSTLRMVFPGNPSTSLAQQIRASVSVTNSEPAAGGEDAPTLDELRSAIPAARNAQGRIVTRADLLARIYKMPSNFGRVFRAGVRSNPRNPLAAQIFIISRNNEGKLVISPDTLKKNLRTFLNSFRLISGAIDILDAQVVNIGVEFKISTEPDAVKNLVIQDIITRLTRFFDVKNFQIDQPVSIDDVHNIIYNSPGVVSVIDVKVRNYSGVVQERIYSSTRFDVASNIRKRLIIGPPGSIFELRYPQVDIVGSAI